MSSSPTFYDKLARGGASHMVNCRKWPDPKIRCRDLTSTVLLGLLPVVLSTAFALADAPRSGDEAAPQGTGSSSGAQPPARGAGLAASGELGSVIRQLVENPVFPHRDTRGMVPAEFQPACQMLQTHMAEWVTGPDLAPLRVEIGLAGEELFFAHSGEVLLALALAYPHLEEPVRSQTAYFLRRQWREHPPLEPAGWYGPAQGVRRELYPLPAHLVPKGQPAEIPHPLAHIYSIWAYGYYLDLPEAWGEVLTKVREVWQDFRKRSLKPRSKTDRLWANAYLGGLLAVVRIARQLGEEKWAEEAEADCAILAHWLVDRFCEDARQLTIPEFTDVLQFDRWRAEDRLGFFLVLRPHKAKPDKCHGLVPEVGVLLGRVAPEPAAAYLRFVDNSLPGWYLVGEERQFHYGENFMDYPDLALSVFQAQAYFAAKTPKELARWVDIPLCKGDAYFVHKLAITLHRAVEEADRR